MSANIIPILVWGILGLILIYLIFQRIKEKKKEDFEDRDN